MDAPEVRYAKSGDVNVAYAVVGDGPFDLVLVGGWVLANLEHAWEGPAADFFTRLASFSRLILFDKRGTGLSDRTSVVADLETRMDDVRAVMDAAGSQRAALMGVSEGGPMTVLFAATYPERVAAAILYASRMCYRRSEDYPWSPSPEEWAASVERAERRWATGEGFDASLDAMVPSLAHDPSIRAWWRRWLRASVSPGAVAHYYRMYPGIDVREVLPAISVPTLVLHRKGDPAIVVDEGRYAAARIPGAELVELPGRDHAWFVDPEQITAPVQRFLGDLWRRGEWDEVESERVLATVLFTDIVESTEKTVAIGDRAWPPSRAHPPAPRPLPRPGAGHRRGRVLRELRRARARDPLRQGDRRGRARAGHRDPRGPAHGRVRDRRRQGGRHRRPHRRARSVGGGAERGARLEYREGPRRRLGHRVRRPRVGRAEGRARRVAPIRRRVGLTGAALVPDGLGARPSSP
jgi:pimeloyl-ACP methyl ester carboxylesterase